MTVPLFFKRPKFGRRALTHLQTSVEASLARIEDTVGGVVARLDALEDGP